MSKQQDLVNLSDNVSSVGSDDKSTRLVIFLNLAECTERIEECKQLLNINSGQTDK